MIDDAGKAEIVSALKILVRDYMHWTRWKVSCGNALRIKRGGHEQKNATTYSMTETYQNKITAWMAEAEEQKKLVAKQIVDLVHRHPLWTEFLAGYVGVGEISAGVLIAYYDINIATTVSKLWAFSGFAPGRDRHTRGEKAPFCATLRTYLIGGMASAFVKIRESAPRKYYDDYKGRLEQEDGWKEATKGHRDAAAKRYMMKMFLRDLYVAWRALEGLPVRRPYEEEYLGRAAHGA